MMAEGSDVETDPHYGSSPRSGSAWRMQIRIQIQVVIKIAENESRSTEIEKDEEKNLFYN